MTAVPGDSVVAGRLEIPVESDTKGFKERLKKAVEKAAEGIVAQIEVEFDTKAIRKKLEKSVEKAAAGVVATIGVDVDASTLKAKLEAAAKAAGGVTVHATVEGLAEEVRKEVAKAEATAGDVDVAAKVKGPGFLASLARYIGLGRAMASKNPITVPVQQGGAGGKGGGKFELPEWAKPKGGARSSFMPIGILGIASVIQPAIAAIVGSLGGLVAMASSAAASLNLLGGAGGAVLGLASSMTVLTLAFGGLFQSDIDKVPKRLLPIRAEFEKLRPEMEKFSKTVTNSFWDEWKDKIEDTGKVVMPLLTEGLSGVGRELGETAKKTAAWMRSPLFKGRAASIFYTLRTVTDGFGAALLGSAKGFVNITAAAGPMLSKLGDVMRNFGTWASGIGDTADEQLRLGAMFDYAWKKAAQLWDMTKSLGAGLKEMFTAGRQSGDNLLQTLQENLKTFREWTESTEGQARMQQWFENVEPIARAAGRLIVDLGKAIARLSEDASTAGLLEKIRLELLPSLETFLRNLGTTLGPKVIEFITNLLHVLTQMSAAGSPLAQGLSIINGLVSGLAEVFRANPALAKNVGILLGTLLAFRALTFFSSIIPGLAALTNFVRGGGKAAWAGAAGGILLFSGQLSGLPGAVQGAVGALSALLTLIPSIRNFAGTGRGFGDFGAHVQLMGRAFTEAKGPMSGFSGASKGVIGSLGYAGGAIGGGLKGAVSGLIGLLGGPWGIALTAASAALGVWMQNAQKTDEIAAKLRTTIDQTSGAFTTQSNATVKDALLGDLSTEDIKRMQELGVNFDDLAQAALQGGPALEKAQQQLAGMKNFDWLFMKDDADVIDGLQASLGRAGDGAERSKILFGELGSGVSAAADGITGATTGIGSGLGAIAGAARDAVPPALDLAAAIERITGVTLSSREASRQFEEAKDNLSAAFARNGKAISNNTQAGRDNNAALDAFAQATTASIKADSERGASIGKVTKKMEGARTEFVNMAHKMGYSETAANKLADELGLTGTAAQVMNKKIQGIKDKKVTITAVDRATRIAQIAQTAIDNVKGASVNVVATFKTLGLYGTLRAIQQVKHPELWANGGIREYANGGIAAMGRRVKSFANGAERHIAQIARAGEYRVWAEPETGGEAYIPLAASKRARSMQILEDVAQRFGMALAPVASSFAASMPSAGTLAPAGAAGAFAAPPVWGARPAPNITFEAGAFQIHNPEPEPASKSVVDGLRSVGEFGLFGGDE